MRDIKEFQILDLNAAHFGIDLFDLMLEAGNRLGEYILEEYDSTDLFIFVCGKGNNAGDGFVAASKLHERGENVVVIRAEKNLKNLSSKALKLYDGIFEDFDFLENVNDKSVLVVDCLLGSGIKGKPRGPYDVLISNINKFKKILSVDVPSGFMTSTSVLPSQTVTFHDTKIGMNEHNCGKIVKIDIGIKPQIDEKCGPGELLLFPKLVSGRHKGENGKVAIVGGGEFAGAPSFAGLASYRVGVDLVHLFVPSVSYPQVSSFAPELLVHEINSNVITPDIVPQLKSYNFDCVVVGPGMGKSKHSLTAVQEIINNFNNVVIDADAIGSYELNGNNILFTPHAGELERLGLKPNRESLISYANYNNVTILLKGEIDMISNGLFYKENFTGHPRMAVGGTGDMLAGMCGGLIARGLLPFEAARLSTYVIGLAGEKCFRDNGPGFLPSDLGLSISQILGEI